MPQNISYKSFCWCFGTTSFRTKNFNQNIERQLALLDQFWHLEENQGQSWAGNAALQTRYYDFMHEQGFVLGDAGNKAKDAREKTSGLTDIGLLNGQRRLTPAGHALLAVSQNNDFHSDNFLQIPKDSYIYLKQLLKTYYYINGECVRPFLILLYLSSQLASLSLEEYTYLLPLCTNAQRTQQIIADIRRLRQGETNIDHIILNRLMEMENYQQAWRLLQNNPVDENLLCQIGMNRKSRTYDRPYYDLYRHLYTVYIHGQADALPLVYQASQKIKIGSWWRSYLFRPAASLAAIRKDPTKYQKANPFDQVANENDFKTVFFQTMHLLKAKSTLADYFDLNKRYMQTANILLFADGMVKLDIVPKHFFHAVADQLYEQAFTPSPLLFQDAPLTEIAPCLNADTTAIIAGVNAEWGVAVSTLDEARNVLNANRYARLTRLINEKFNRQQLIHLLDCFEQRRDKEIQNLITDNADIPTIFEYVLGILWYTLSGCQGNILEYMNLSLDANLLPVTHAAGGLPDIVYEYAATAAYPAHSLLLEATLTDGANQRRSEMEPVSRHLGRYLLQNGNQNAYCIFVTNTLDINVIADFRSRKTTPYYDTQNPCQFIEGMKIIPLQTKELKQILRQKYGYTHLYPLLEEAFQSTLPPHLWYENCLKDRL